MTIISLQATKHGFPFIAFKRECYEETLTKNNPQVTVTLIVKISIVLPGLIENKKHPVLTHENEVKYKMTSGPCSKQLLQSL